MQSHRPQRLPPAAMPHTALPCETPDVGLQLYPLVGTFLPQEAAQSPGCCPPSSSTRSCRSPSSRGGRSCWVQGTRERLPRAHRATLRPPHSSIPPISQPGSPALTRTARERLRDTTMATMPTAMLCGEEILTQHNAAASPAPTPSGPAWGPSAPHGSHQQPGQHRHDVGHRVLRGDGTLGPGDVPQDGAVHDGSQHQGAVAQHDETQPSTHQALRLSQGPRPPSPRTPARHGRQQQQAARSWSRPEAEPHSSQARKEAALGYLQNSLLKIGNDRNEMREQRRVQPQRRMQGCGLSPSEHPQIERRCRGS